MLKCWMGWQCTVPPPNSLASSRCPFFLPKLQLQFLKLARFPAALDFCVALSLPGVSPPVTPLQDAWPDDLTWIVFYHNHVQSSMPQIISALTQVTFKFHMHSCLTFLSTRVPVLRCRNDIRFPFFFFFLPLASARIWSRSLRFGEVNKW